MFCTSCGNEIPNDSVFCIKCGEKIKKVTMGKITICRSENKLYRGSVIVHMDGKVVGRSQFNTLQIPAEIGQHKLLFETAKINAVTINVTEEYPNVYIELLFNGGRFNAFKQAEIVDIRSEK